MDFCEYDAKCKQIFPLIRPIRQRAVLQGKLSICLFPFFRYTLLSFSSLFLDCLKTMLGLVSI